MAERLPTPCLQIGFEPSAALPDCLRSALQTAKRLGLGVLFERDGQEYCVWPWMSTEHALGLWDMEQAASVQAHVEAHRG